MNLARRVLVAASSALFVAASPSRAAAAETLESTELPITVVYEDAKEAELGRAVLAHAEHAWSRLIVDLGYATPATGGGASAPVRGMSFRIAPTGLGPGTAITERGVDLPDTPACDCSSSIVIDAGTPVASADLASTVFHELVHATQYAIDCTEAPSAYEGFAVAAVAKEVPRDASVAGVVGQFQRFPEYSLDYWTMHMPCDGKEPCFPYQLGAALFPLYLVDRFEGGDPRALGALFGTFGQPGTVVPRLPKPSCSNREGPSWLDGVRRFLELHGTTFDDAFDEFTRWRAITGAHDDAKHFAGGASLPEPAIAKEHALDGAFEGLLYVYEWGTRYVELVGIDTAPARTWRFEVSGAAAARWRASLLVWRDGHPIEPTPLVFSGAGGEASVTFPADATRALLIVSQLDDGAHEAEAMDYVKARSFHYAGAPVDGAPESPASGVGFADPPGDRGAACGIARQGACGASGAGALAAAAVVAGLVLRRRSRERIAPATSASDSGPSP